MPFEIAQNNKFGCLAIQNASVAEELRGQIELAPGLWCVDRLPFGVGDFWTNQLGEGRVEQIMRSNVLIFCIAPAQSPQVLDGENEALKQRVQRIFYALLMQLVFHHDGVELFTGAHADGNPDIRQITDLRNHYRPPQVRVAGSAERISFGRQALREASKSICDELVEQTACGTAFMRSKEVSWSFMATKDFISLLEQSKPFSG